jgi:hypothetical protein
MRLSALAFLCACATAAPRPPAVRAVALQAGQCEGEAAADCYRKGRQLLESRQPEAAQQSMEYMDIRIDITP